MLIPGAIFGFDKETPDSIIFFATQK